jgi:hypothetical protein
MKVLTPSKRGPPQGIVDILLNEMRCGFSITFPRAFLAEGGER